MHSFVLIVDHLRRLRSDAARFATSEFWKSHQLGAERRKRGLHHRIGRMYFVHPGQRLPQERHYSTHSFVHGPGTHIVFNQRQMTLQALNLFISAFAH